MCHKSHAIRNFLKFYKIIIYKFSSFGSQKICFVFLMNATFAYLPFNTHVSVHWHWKSDREPNTLSLQLYEFVVTLFGVLTPRLYLNICQKRSFGSIKEEVKSKYHPAWPLRFIQKFFGRKIVNIIKFLNCFLCFFKLFYSNKCSKSSSEVKYESF